MQILWGWVQILSKWVRSSNARHPPGINLRFQLTRKEALQLGCRVADCLIYFSFQADRIINGKNQAAVLERRINFNNEHIPCAGHILEVTLAVFVVGGRHFFAERIKPWSSHSFRLCHDTWIIRGSAHK